VALTSRERNVLIETYAAGPARLREALAAVPEKARKWRPRRGKWSVHEIVCHCADAETNGAARIRYLLAEPSPLLVAYDQDAWAKRLDYHEQPLQPALQTVEAVRATTSALIRRLPKSAWSKKGRHTESGTYSAEGWLRIYAEHLHKHADQIERNLAAWRARRGA
jgi:hypothetical protein